MVTITVPVSSLRDSSLTTIGRSLVTNTLRICVALPEGCWFREAVQIDGVIVKTSTCTSSIPVRSEPSLTSLERSSSTGNPGPVSTKRVQSELG